MGEKAARSAFGLARGTVPSPLSEYRFSVVHRSLGVGNDLLKSSNDLCLLGTSATNRNRPDLFGSRPNYRGMEHRMTREKLVKAGIYLLATLLVATVLTTVLITQLRVA